MNFQPMATERLLGANRANYYKTGKAERWGSLIILVTLTAVAVGVGLKQRSFNPAVLVAVTPSSTEKALVEEEPALPPELQPLGRAENFNPDNLYDKIDGKAELYLAAGFQQLHCQRFALSAAPDQWLEWFVYDMGSLPHAFSVFSTQRRAEAQSLPLAPYAYRTQNGLYFVSGNNYVEALGSAASAPLMDALLELARRWVTTARSNSARLAELEIFPAENLVLDSQALEVANAFGFDQFTNVFTAQYEVQGAAVTAFVTLCPSATAAEALRNAYSSFLLANGGKALPVAGTLGDRFEIMGGTELCFSEGDFVAGIHSALSVEAAEQIALRLRQRLAAAKSESHFGK